MLTDFGYEFLIPLLELGGGFESAGGRRITQALPSNLGREMGECQGGPTKSLPEAFL